jgi:hypothetical protein
MKKITTYCYEFMFGGKTQAAYLGSRVGSYARPLLLVTLLIYSTVLTFIHFS